MKTKISLIVLCILVLSLITLSFQEDDGTKAGNMVASDTSSNYLDGTYHGYSQASYTGEQFWGHIRIALANGSFTDIQFTIRDSVNHEPVDSMYGVNHYAGNPEYMQQCVNEEHGIEAYPQRLMESQNFDNVDAITGATWSYNIFMASAEVALQDAHKPTLINADRDQANRNFMQLVPNPFYSVVTLEYSLAESSQVNIGIYDSQGKLIKRLASQAQPAGHYSLQWDDCPSAGLYYCYLQTDNRVYCSKLINTGK